MKTIEQLEAEIKEAMVASTDGTIAWPAELSSYETDQMLRGFQGSYTGPFGGPLDVDEHYELGVRLAGFVKRDLAGLKAKRNGAGR